MGKTFVINERTGERFPEKTKKKIKNHKKFMGHTSGNHRKQPFAVPGVDYVKYYYEQNCELRHKSVILKKTMEELLDEEINDEILGF